MSVATACGTAVPELLLCHSADSGRCRSAFRAEADPDPRPANLAGPNSSAMRVRFRGYVFFTSFEKFCIRHYSKFVAEQGIALHCSAEFLFPRGKSLSARAREAAAPCAPVLYDGFLNRCTRVGINWDKGTKGTAHQLDCGKSSKS